MKNIMITLGCFGLFFTSAIGAHDGATGIVKERMDAMSVLGDQSKTVVDMLKGKTGFDADKIYLAAETFIEHGSRITSLFPDTEQSRNGKETDALPKIWKNWTDFEDRANDLVLHSEALKEVIASTEDRASLKRALYRITRNCSGCHKQYRKPKD